MTNQDYRETMADRDRRNIEKASNVAIYAGMSLEEMEAKSDALHDRVNAMKRSDPEWASLNSEIRRIDDAIFAITG